MSNIKNTIKYEILHGLYSMMHASLFSTISWMYCLIVWWGCYMKVLWSKWNIWFPYCLSTFVVPIDPPCVFKLSVLTLQVPFQCHLWFFIMQMTLRCKKKLYCYFKFSNFVTVTLIVRTRFLNFTTFLSPYIEIHTSQISFRLLERFGR